jgi:hypothetical protein
MQVDSLKIVVPPDSIAHIGKDSGIRIMHSATPAKPELKKIVDANAITSSIDYVQNQKSHSISAPDTVKTVKKPETSDFSLFGTLQKAENGSLVVYPNQSLNKHFTTSINSSNKLNGIIVNQLYKNGWILGFGLISICLLVVIRIYFQKYLTSIISSLFNAQITEKLAHEKNVLIRRVFVLLNLNFCIATSLYFYFMVKMLNLSVPVNSKILIILSIFVLLLLFLLVRLLIYYTIGFVFDSLPLFKEYIHNTYLLNKILGLFLLPLVIIVFYLQQNIAEIVFYICSGMIIITLLYRYLRAIQLILRNKVFLFYSFLYLCTLEILPVLIGIKFILSLR